MTLFSQRYGHKDYEIPIQKNNLEDGTRNRIWNIFTYVFVFLNPDDISGFSSEIWHSYFRKPDDIRPKDKDKITRELRSYFFSCEWFEVYDFCEFFYKWSEEYKYESFIKGFKSGLNTVLEEDNSAYRLVGDKITPIIDDEEIQEIETSLAVSNSDDFSLVRQHIKTALEKLSDRESPDFRNSIKESISAVEATAKKIVGDDSATLGQALNKINETIPLHGALKDAYKKIYGYTSDGDGIRHSLMEEDNLQYEDAQYMLVSCSAFSNYLIGKYRRLNS